MARITFEVNTLPLLSKVRGVQGFIRETLWLDKVGKAQAQWVSDNIESAGLEKPWRTMRPNTRAARPSRRSNRHFSTAFEQRLLRGIFIRTHGRQVSVGINAEHADLHHGGTRPHPITARRAALLRFETRKGTVFARRVQHPGFPARKMLPSKKLASHLSRQALEIFIKETIRKRGNK